MNAHVGMLGVNSDKAKKLAASLKRKGFRYVCPLNPPMGNDAMIRHGFIKRDEFGNVIESRSLNERTNGFHNVTEL
jgi:hypothetical protein